MATFFNINLINPQPYWCPGDTVVGELVLRAGEQVDIQAISICLKGKAKTRYRRSNGNNSHTYRAKVSFFRLNSILFQGPFTLSPGNMSWPFQFVIPLDCRLSVGDKFETDNLFDSSNEQMLPPSFSASGMNKDCQVEYCLEGTLTTSKTFARNKETYAPLFIIPRRMLEIANYARVLLPHSFTFQTLHLDPDVAQRGLTFKERMRSTFKSETLPMSAFTIKIELPEATEPNAPINPVLYLEHNLQRSTAAELPVVKLTAFSIALKYEVWIRTSGSWTSSHVQEWTEGQQVGNWVGQAPLSERFELSKLFRDGLAVRWAAAPTFRTFNIAILYRWKVKYTVECATKTSSAEHSRPCVVLGAEQRIPQFGEQRLAQIEAPPPLIDAGEQLPAYSKQPSAIVT